MLIILSLFLLKSIFSYSVIITIYIVYNSLMSHVAYSHYISFFYKILFFLELILIFIFVGYSVCVYVFLCLYSKVCWLSLHMTSPFFQVKELPIFNLVPFFKCSQVYGQRNGNKMSCGSSQEIFLSHCWLMPFAPFFPTTFSLSCYISNRNKVNIMTKEETVIWPMK